MSQLSPNSTIGRGSDFVATKVGPQTMMMSVTAGKYFAVAETAQRIWDLLETPKTITEVVDLLRTEYDVPAETCLADVTEFATDLMAHGLVMEVTNGQSA